MELNLIINFLLKEVLNRQNTFRPVFGVLLRANATERKHATYLRRLLAENNLDYDIMKEAYDADAKNGLETLIKSKVCVLLKRFYFVF